MMQGTFVCVEGAKSWNVHKPALWRYGCVETTKPCWQLTALLCSLLQILRLASKQGANLFFNALHEMPITDPILLVCACFVCFSLISCSKLCNPGARVGIGGATQSPVLMVCLCCAFCSFGSLISCFMSHLHCRFPSQLMLWLNG
jgi:hypothetical protein